MCRGPGFREPRAFQAIVSPSDAVLVAGLTRRTWQTVVAFVVGQANRVRESGVDLGGARTLRLPPRNRSSGSMN